MHGYSLPCVYNYMYPYFINLLLMHGRQILQGFSLSMLANGSGLETRTH